LYAQNTNSASEEARQATIDNQKANKKEGGQAQKESDDLLSSVLTVKTKDNANDSIFLSDSLVFLGMIAAALFIASLWKYAPKLWDMKMAMTAAIIQISSVLYSMFQTRSRIDAGTYEVTKYEDGTVNNMQLDALKKQRESYVALKDHGSFKVKVEMAAAAAYTIAAGFAFNKALEYSVASTACSKKLMLNQCTESVAYNLNKKKALWDKMPCQMTAPQLQASIEARNSSISFCKGPAAGLTGAAKGVMIAETMATCMVATKKYSESVVQICPHFDLGVNMNMDIFDFSANNIANSSLQSDLGKNYVQYEDSYAYLHFALLGADGKQDNSLLKLAKLLGPALYKPEHLTGNAKSFDLFSLILPSAHAYDFSVADLGLGVGATLAFKLINGKIRKWMDTMVVNPAYRGTFYSFAASISSVAAGFSNKAASEAEANIKKIDSIIEKLESLQTMGVLEGRENFKNIGLYSSMSPLNNGEILILPDGKSLNCPKNKETGKCISLQKGLTRNHDVSGLGSGIGRISSLSGSVADSIVKNGKFDKASIDGINEIASQSALANRALKRVQDKFNKQRTENGRPSIDFEKTKKGIISELGSIIDNSLKESKLSAGQLSASLGGPSRNSEELAKEKPLNEKLKEASALTNGSFNIQALPNTESGDYIFDFGEEEAEGEIFEGELDEYNSGMYAKALDAQRSAKGTDQIVGDRDVSIFRVISVRYMKSGLPRLLEQLKGSKEGRLQELE